MKFGEIAIEEAVGAVLAHSVRAGGKRVKKGRVLSAADVALIQGAGRTRLVVARLETGEVTEDAAAGAVARAAAGEGVACSEASTGRCNLFAERRGLVLFERERLDRVNLVDEAVTFATVSPFAPVEPRQMVATIKVIPFAAPARVVEECAAIAAEGGPLMQIAPFRRLDAGLVLTRLPDSKESLLDKAVGVLRARMENIGGSLTREERCPHESDAVARSLSRMLADGADMVLISGAAAIIDRRDVIPAAIERAGGRIDHFGMPVDPGNLLLLAHKGEVPVLGLPSCARSPKLNGFDWVLERLAAGIAVGREEVMSMGAGGLLKEIPSRPLPRVKAAGMPSKTGEP